MTRNYNKVYIKNFGWLIKVFIEGQKIIIKYI